jgi:carbonic anhydrase
VAELSRNGSLDEPERDEPPDIDIDFAHNDRERVLQYGITVLNVRHIIVCGHYNCGGVAHSMKGGGTGVVDQWLEQLRALHLSHAAELERIADDGSRLDRMVELSTMAQLSNLEQMPVVQQARARGALQLHAWVYDLRTGYLKELQHPDAAVADRAP